MSQVQVVIYKHMEFNSPKIPEIPANKQVYTYRYVIIIHTVSWNSVECDDKKNRTDGQV